MPAKKKISFVVKFVGPGISPDTVPLRAINDTIISVQRLAAGISDDDDDRTAEENVHIVSVDRGSAVYSCFTKAKEATKRIKDAQWAINNFSKVEDDQLDYIFRPTETLSRVAKGLGCEIEIRQSMTSKTIAVFDAETYDKLTKHAVVRGETSLLGIIVRVGGSTRNRCVLKVRGRRRLLFCNVESEELARKMGQWLYEEVTISGIATWIGKRWYLKRMNVQDASKMEFVSPKQAFLDLRACGGDAWDGIRDVDAYLNGEVE